MLKNLSWSNSLAIGIDIIDEQYKRSFDYFDDIEHCIKTNDDTNIIEYLSRTH